MSTHPKSFLKQSLGHFIQGFGYGIPLFIALNLYIQKNGSLRERMLAEQQLEDSMRIDLYSQNNQHNTTEPPINNKLTLQERCNWLDNLNKSRWDGCSYSTGGTYSISELNQAEQTLKKHIYCNFAHLRQLCSNNTPTT